MDDNTDASTGQPEEMTTIDVAGRTLTLPRALADRVMSPEGWGSLTAEELAAVGIVPGMTQTETPPPHATFRPDGE